MVDIELNKVDVYLLQKTTVRMLRFSSRVLSCSWLWDHLSGGVGAANRWRCITSEGTAIVNLLSDIFTERKFSNLSQDIRQGLVLH
jgi:hypothetical protein